MTTATRSQLLVNRIAIGLIGAAVTAAAILGQPADNTGPATQTQVAAVAQTGPAQGCWTEPKPDGSTERIYGDLDLAPAGSTPLDCAAFGEPADRSDKGVQEDDPSWDCRTMGNLVCGDGATVNGAEVPAGDYTGATQVAAPVGACLEKLGYSAGPVVRSHAVWCSKVDRLSSPAPAAGKGGAKAGGGRVTEDSAGWSCARNGNHVCGPGNPQGAPAGCYRNGQLVEPWVNYSDPKSDPLWGQMTPPC